MKRKLLTICAILALLFTTHIVNAQKRTFTVVNNTGKTIYSLMLYYESIGDDYTLLSDDTYYDWTDNLLNGVDLENNASALITVPDFLSSNCIFTLKIANSDGDVSTYEPMDFCKNEKVTIFSDRTHKFE